MIGLDRPVLGRDLRSLDQRQQIALHALAADIGPADALAAPADLVDLVEEDNAVLLHRGDGLGCDTLLVQQLVAFLGHEQAMTVGDAHPLGLGPAAEGLAQHIVQIDYANAGPGHARYLEGGKATTAVAKLDFDLPVLQPAR